MPGPFDTNSIYDQQQALEAQLPQYSVEADIAHKMRKAFRGPGPEQVASDHLLNLKEQELERLRGAMLQARALRELKGY